MFSRKHIAFCAVLVMLALGLQGCEMMDKAKAAASSASSKAKEALAHAKEKAGELAEHAKGKLAEAKEKAGELAEHAKGKLSEAKDAVGAKVASAKEAAVAEKFDANMPAIKAAPDSSFMSGATAMIGIAMTALVVFVVFARRAHQRTTMDTALNENLSDAEAPEVE